MSLVARLEPVPETVKEMEDAADGRFQEGTHLINSDLSHAGIYLLGYAAEICLKTALWRVDSVRLPTDLVGAVVGTAGTRWNNVFGGRRPSGHDLLFLSLMLEDERSRVYKPSLPAVSAIASRAFYACIGRIHENWFVSMRYRRQDALVSEADAMRDDVEWLRTNYEFLWR